MILVGSTKKILGNIHESGTGCNAICVAYSIHLGYVWSVTGMFYRSNECYNAYIFNCGLDLYSETYMFNRGLYDAL